MVYKKYITRDGEKYGPYYYESYRDEFGNIKTKYLKDYKPVKHNKLFFISIIGISFFLFVLLFFLILNFFPDFKMDSSNFFDFSLNSIKSLTGFAVQEDSGEGVSEELEEPLSVEEEIPEEISEEEPLEEEQEPETEEVLVEEIDLSEEDSESNKTDEFAPVEEVNNETVQEEFALNQSSEEETNVSNILIEEEPKDSDVREEKVSQKENQTVEEDISEEEIFIENLTEVQDATNFTISTIQYEAVLNQPVKWKKNVKLDRIEKITIELPEEAENITVFMLNEEQEEFVEEVIEGETKKIKQEVPKNKIKITGNFIAEGGSSEEKSKIYNILRKIFSSITGRVIELQEIEGGIEILIEENSTEYDIEYETPGPVSFEEEILKGKRIIISSDLEYQNILSYTSLPAEMSNINSLKLYHIVDGSRIEVDFEAYDTNNNSLYDFIEWIVPHLSNQTYELEITILNVQSYPVVDGEWEIKFTTSGESNLTIRAVEGTTWSDSSNNEDLRFLEIRCGEDVLDYQWVENEIFIQDYECNEVGYEISKVLTSGVHVLEFEFGGIIARAYNSATNSSIPQTLNLHGKLTDENGTALNGTYNMSFKIYDSYTGGSVLWEIANQSITVDTNGVYNYILPDVNIGFEGLTYLGISVGEDSEMTPRINLTSTPYSYRAKTADSLNTSNNYQMQNLSLSDKITFGFGEMIDNLVNDWLKITGNLNVTGNITAPYYCNSTNCYTMSDLLVSSGEDNSSWNQTFADGLYSGIEWDYNQTTPAITWANDTIQDNNASWSSTYNSTYESTYNATYDSKVTDNESWNQTLADSLYIEDSTEGDLDVNSSGYWDSLDTYNTTQMEQSGSTLNILQSWLESLFYFKDTIVSMISGNVTADGSLNSTSWNRSGTDVFLANAGDSVGIGTSSPTHELNVVGNTNITTNLTVERIVLENDEGHNIYDNSTCVIIKGDTSTLNIC